MSTGLVAREAVSVYKIPSRSMEPTILSGDLLLVEKLSPKVGVKPKSGEIVLFTPPPRLKEVVAATGGRVGPRDLFVKRVAATPGDRVRVDRGGNAYVNGEFYAEGQQCNLDFESDLLQNLIGAGGAGEAEVPRDASYVLGDCGDVSVDSRVWGPLEDAKVKACLFPCLFRDMLRVPRVPAHRHPVLAYAHHVLLRSDTVLTVPAMPSGDRPAHLEIVAARALRADRRPVKHC